MTGRSKITDAGRLVVCQGLSQGAVTFRGLCRNMTLVTSDRALCRRSLQSCCSHGYVDSMLLQRPHPRLWRGPKRPMTIYYLTPRGDEWMQNMAARLRTVTTAVIPKPDTSRTVVASPAASKPVVLAGSSFRDYYRTSTGRKIPLVGATLRTNRWREWARGR